jgi:hypothetical protein
MGYASDLRDEEWVILEPLLEPRQKGHPRLNHSVSEALLVRTTASVTRPARYSLISFAINCLIGGWIEIDIAHQFPNQGDDMCRGVPGIAFDFTVEQSELFAVDGTGG